ncbi:unnamed protein product [Lactuca saligna]|uniref:Uncharacterized protein n=1 Tax=Lactuca saligna TaxID=75948 RepID=A0AA35Z879_LACSI|nr:unnamed protein product [Lactuca saligna]
MASRPNFGLNELDFVFSTLVVGSIMNFTLMYLLAPTMASSSATLPFIFSNSPTSHMFEPGAYSLVNRLGTFVYKGTVFAAVGFAAGLVGTALSNGLIQMRKKMDPTFESPNKAPPTVLNAMTWAIHMGLSSNFRYQTLNGIEFVFSKRDAAIVVQDFCGWVEIGEQRAWRDVVCDSGKDDRITKTPAEKPRRRRWWVAVMKRSVQRRK